MPSSKKEKILNNKYSSFLNSDRPEPEPEPESSGERIYPTLRNMDANTLQRLRADRDRSDQRSVKKICRASQDEVIAQKLI